MARPELAVRFEPSLLEKHGTSAPSVYGSPGNSGAFASLQPVGNPLEAPRRNAVLPPSVDVAASGRSAVSAAPERLVIRSAGHVLLVPCGEIEWVESAGNYLWLHTRGTIHRIRGTMAWISSQLDPEKFLRIHRCAIVNASCVEYLEPAAGAAFRGEYTIVLRGGARLRMSRGHSAALLPRLQSN